MRPRALPVLLIAALAATGLAACGGDAETTVVSTTTVTTSTATNSTTIDLGTGPGGPMTADGVGEVQVGDAADDLIAAFGDADTEEELPGCELGTDPQPLTQYGYDLGDGTLKVNVDAETDEVVSYFTDSPSLETEHGDRVGDSWDALAASWGAALDPIVLGAEPTPKLGAYKVGPDGGNQLIFDLEDRTVQRISGGYLPPCE